MRAIKFRGKAHGRWIYGGLVYSDNIEPAIYFEVGNKVYKRIDWAYVDPATVGQFTGMLDKNGREIFEGDIVRHDENDKCYSIIYEEPMFRFAPNDDCFAFLNHPELLEVVGNIHDNKSLLEKGGNQ